MWGAITSAAGLVNDIFGGGDSGPSWADQAQQNWDMLAAQQRFQREWNAKALKFARRQWLVNRNDSFRAIQNRVRDARNAGIHPLYALGMSANVSPTTFVPGQSPGGNASIAGFGAGESAGYGAAVGALGRVASSRAVNRKNTKLIEREQQRLEETHKAQLDNYKSRTALNEAEAHAVRSAAAREAQKVNQTGSGRVPDVEKVPDVQIATKKGGLRTAGVHAPARDYYVGKDDEGNKILIPGALESGGIDEHAGTWAMLGLGKAEKWRRRAVRKATDGFETAHKIFNPLRYLRLKRKGVY